MGDWGLSPEKNGELRNLHWKALILEAWGWEIRVNMFLTRHPFLSPFDKAVVWIVIDTNDTFLSLGCSGYYTSPKDTRQNPEFGGLNRTDFLLPFPRGLPANLPERAVGELGPILSIGSGSNFNCQSVRRRPDCSCNPHFFLRVGPWRKTCSVLVYCFVCTGVVVCIDCMACGVAVGIVVVMDAVNEAVRGKPGPL